MDLHQLFRVLGGVLTLLLFIPLITLIFRNGGTGQSFATWVLWGALDVILFFSLLQQDGNYWVAAGFATGDVMLAAFLLSRGRAAWGRFETGILLAVVVCLTLWYVGGPKVATIASTLGVCIGGLPGLMALWREPDRKLGRIWAGYVLANGISFLGGRAMTIEERFAPGAFTLFSMAMVLASWQRKSPATESEE